MVKNYFNLLRYKELLELEENGKISFMNLELLGYKASVEREMCYKRRKDYFILIHRYLTRIISPDEFRSTFLQTEKEDVKKAGIILKDFQKLETFTLTKNIEKFSDLRNKISTLCFEYDEIWDGTMERMSEGEFYYLVNNHYIQFQEAFPFENFND